MSISVRRGGRDLATSLAPILDTWSGQAPFAANLHSGDVGWQLRLDDPEQDGMFRLWQDGDVPVAAGFLDSGVMRTAIAPDRFGSGELAESMAAGLEGAEYLDAASGTELRNTLLRRGWSADPDPWVLLYRELARDDALLAELADPDSRTLDGEAEVSARVAVQRSAFAPGSTFSAELWTRMAAGPSYDARFEMVTWTPAGEAAAAATGWFAGPGRCAILEPVGTHRDHQRKGYGGRVNLMVMAALARAGASGIRVHTPASNLAAVAAYEACGLRPVDWTVALRAPR